MAKKIQKEVTVGVDKINYWTWTTILFLPAMAIALFFAMLSWWHLSPPELNAIQTFMVGTGCGMMIMLTIVLAYIFYEDEKGWGTLTKKVWKTATVIEEAK